MDDISGSSKQVTCRLSAGADTDAMPLTLPGTVGGWECALEVVHQFTSAGSVTLSIDTPAASVVRVGDVKVIAVQADALTNTPVTG